MEKLYLLGHPVAHSKSPAMHNAAYEALGLDWRYDLMDCATPDEAERFLGSEGWLACNVTMPYKPLAFAVAAGKSAAATLARGANVLVRTPDGLLADNTDGVGAVRYLQRCGVSFEGACVVVCGTGPTSRAIMHACAVAGAESVVLLSRDEGKAQRIVADYLEQLDMLSKAAMGTFAFDDLGHMEALQQACDHAVFTGLSYEKGAQALADANIIIDATSLGMNEGDPAPFDVAVLTADQVVFDVVYGHGVTALVGAARERGCSAFDGSGMLVAQAVETVRDIAEATGAFEIPPSIDLFDVMAQAAGFDL